MCPPEFASQPAGDPGLRDQSPRLEYSISAILRALYEEDRDKASGDLQLPVQLRPFGPAPRKWPLATCRSRSSPVNRSFWLLPVPCRTRLSTSEPRPADSD